MKKKTRAKKYKSPLRQMPLKVPTTAFDAITAEAAKAGRPRTEFVLNALRSQFKSIDKACN